MIRQYFMKDDVQPVNALGAHFKSARFTILHKSNQFKLQAESWKRNFTCNGNCIQIFTGRQFANKKVKVKVARKPPIVCQIIISDCWNEYEYK